MKINEFDYKNKEKINKIYIHDTCIKRFNIDTQNRKINIGLDEEEDGRFYELTFKNVVKLDMYNLNLKYGGYTGTVLDMYLSDYEVKEYIHNMEKKEKEEFEKLNPYSYEFQYDEDKINKMFAVEFMLKNGDRITIICEGLTFTNLSREDAKRDDSNRNLKS